MPFVNDFLVGADPEFVVIEQGHLKNCRDLATRNKPWGLDHDGWVIEPHPKPEFSVRVLVQNLKISMNDYATVSPTGVWKAGAYLAAPERRVTLGGHVHFDRRTYIIEQIVALDLFTKYLEALDILPKDDCVKRRNHGTYGDYSDVRAEHGHFEYRTMPSWLYSQRVTKLCLTGAKLLMVDPGAAQETLGATARAASIEKLKSMFERFRHKDEDADWLLSTTLNRKLNIKPDRDLRDVWKVVPQKEAVSWKAAAMKKAA